MSLTKITNTPSQSVAHVNIVRTLSPCLGKLDTVLERQETECVQVNLKNRSISVLGIYTFTPGSSASPRCAIADARYRTLDPDDYARVLDRTR